MKNHKGEIATFLTLGLVVVGAAITLVTSILTNKQKIALNSRATAYYSCCKVYASSSLCPNNGKRIVNMGNAYESTCAANGFENCSDVGGPTTSGAAICPTGGGEDNLPKCQFGGAEALDTCKSVCKDGNGKLTPEKCVSTGCGKGADNYQTYKCESYGPAPTTDPLSTNCSDKSLCDSACSVPCVTTGCAKRNGKDTYICPYFQSGNDNTDNNDFSGNCAPTNDDGVPCPNLACCYEKPAGKWNVYAKASARVANEMSTPCTTENYTNPSGVISYGATSWGYCSDGGVPVGSGGGGGGGGTSVGTCLESNSGQDTYVYSCVNNPSNLSSTTVCKNYDSATNPTGLKCSPSTSICCYKQKISNRSGSCQSVACPSGTTSYYRLLISGTYYYYDTLDNCTNNNFPATDEYSVIAKACVSCTPENCTVQGSISGRQYSKKPIQPNSSNYFYYASPDCLGNNVGYPKDINSYCTDQTISVAVVPPVSGKCEEPSNGCVAGFSQGVPGRFYSRTFSIPPATRSNSFYYEGKNCSTGVQRTFEQIKAYCVKSDRGTGATPAVPVVAPGPLIVDPSALNLGTPFTFTTQTSTELRCMPYDKKNCIDYNNAELAKKGIIYMPTTLNNTISCCPIDINPFQ